jgi:hypothetical protein
MAQSNWIFEKRKIEKRIRYLAKDGVPKVHETISPAPKNADNLEIESLKEAMDYYAPYSDKVCIQRKYMGSYCLMVLNKDHDKSYFVSRNGYLINYLRDEEGLKDKTLLNRVSAEFHESLFGHTDDVEWLVVEAELMPWRLLGHGLIDKEYGGYGYLHRSHMNILSDSTDIVDKIAELKHKKPWERGDLKSHEKRQYNSLKDIAIPNLGVYGNSINMYDRQLELYGAEGDIEFKPFNIIVAWDIDKQSHFPPNQVFPGHTGDSIVVDVDNYEAAYDFYHLMSHNDAEGVMVKPLRQRLINIAPALKVRTNEYLQLIYGISFNRDFEYFFGKRNVRYKMMQSIKQFENNILMTQIHPEDITESQLYKKLCFRSLDAERFNQTLDHRL